MKTIGVIGGLGPQATMDFEARVHRISQRLLPQWMNSGYPPMVVWYYRNPPMLQDADHHAVQPLQVDPRLLEAAKKIGALADFLVITSNTPHLFHAEIETAAGRNVLSMLRITLDEVTRRKSRKVGVLGFGDPVFYTRQLTEMGLAFETIDGTLRENLNAAIKQVMEGQHDTTAQLAARHAVAELRSRGTDCIILGCTEIPLLLEDELHDADLINPLQLLAESAVRYAIL